MSMLSAPRRHPRRIAHGPRGRRGFTLLDAMLGMSIAALIFGIAVPNYRTAVARAHAASARGAMSTTLFDAMRGALVGGRETVVCPSANADFCVGGTDWSRGWVVFIDLNGDRNRSADEPLLRRQSELSGDVRLRSTQGRPRLVFQPNGGNAGSNVTFTLCDRRGPAEALNLILANSGRLRAQPARAAAAAACASGL